MNLGHPVGSTLQQLKGYAFPTDTLGGKESGSEKGTIQESKDLEEREGNSISSVAISSAP